MPGFIGVIILVLCSLGIVLTGIVWGGPWPPKMSRENGRADELNLGTMRLWTGIWFLGTVVSLWRVNPLDNFVMSYSLLLILPLVLGIIVRRILLLQED